jgi:hypothetical protein
MAELSATVVADSISDHGNRLTTMVLSMPQSLMTRLSSYRALSRTTSPAHTSDLSTLVSDVLLDAFIPAEPLSSQFRSSWLNARDGAVVAVLAGTIGYENLSSKARKNIDANRKSWGETALDAELITGELKSFTDKSERDFVNEVLLLEPFMWTTCLVSATDWDGLTSLRSYGSSGADTSLGGLATMVRDALDESVPTELSEGQWHLPFLTKDELSQVNEGSATNKDRLILASVARCGGVSVGDTSPGDIEAENKFAANALRRGYVSAWEHAATPSEEAWGVDSIVDGLPSWKGGEGTSSNFRGWTQARKLVDSGSVLDSDENLSVVF